MLLVEAFRFVAVVLCSLADLLLQREYVNTSNTNAYIDLLGLFRWSSSCSSSDTGRSASRFSSENIHQNVRIQDLDVCNDFAYLGFSCFLVLVKGSRFLVGFDLAFSAFLVVPLPDSSSFSPSLPFSASPLSSVDASEFFLASFWCSASSLLFLSLCLEKMQDLNEIVQYVVRWLKLTCRLFWMIPYL